MDSQIAVLPATVIDQIAAGEVIERPASVVRELVDNAIDAGAKHVTIEATAGGRALIRIVDDGCGMNARDAVLAFERHATSKLRAVDDLWGLATLGFRGEALPSIASVARVTLTTRRQADLAATRVQIEGGKLVSVTEIGAPVGTSIEVTDLFYCVPARLKFLKGEGTEASHITDHIAKIAMAHHALHIRLRHNGRVALDAPPDRDAFSRVQALLGPRVASRLIEVTGEEAAVRIRAFLGAPDLAQTTARGVQLFVGARPVRDRGILHALAMGYGELVPRGRYPFAIVMLDAPAGSVDVNVHPAKAEVRFADANAIAAAVRHVVQAGVERAGWRADQAGVMMTAIASVAPPRLAFDSPATALAQTYAAQLRESRDRPWSAAARDAAAIGQGELGFDASPRSSSFDASPRSSSFDASPRSSSFDASPRMWAQSIKDRVRTERAAEAALATRAANALTQVVDAARIARDAARDDLFGHGEARETSETLAAPQDDVQLAEGSTPTVAPGFFSSLRYLGQLDLTYLVCESDGELVLIDQHIAHERVELTRLKAGHGDREIVQTQRMLFPTTIDVKPELVDLATTMADVLAQVGFEAEAFGKTTLAVKAVPGGIRHGDPTQLLRALLTEWADEGAPSEAERLERILAEVACHSVVRAGDRLSPSEAEALLRSMDGADFATRGPHNRPVLLRLPLSEIARRFGR